MNKIPSVNLADFLSSDKSKKQQFIDKIGHAYENIEFVALKGHFLLDPEPRSWLSSHLPLFENYLANLWQEAAKDAIWLSGDEIPLTLEPLMDYMQRTYQKFATFSIAAAKANEKFFDLDVGYGVFTARSMKRLEKARLHVQDELRRCHGNSLPINKQGVLDFYLAD